MEVANALAYNNMATITAVKSFIVQAPGCFFRATRKYDARLKMLPETNTIACSSGASLTRKERLLTSSPGLASKSGNTASGSVTGDRGS
jgi:hypothetical protein